MQKYFRYMTKFSGWPRDRLTPKWYVSAHLLCFRLIISALSGNFTYRQSTSSAEVTRHMKNNLFPVALKLAPGGIFGTSNVNSSSSASVASKVNTNVSPKVTLIEVRFCRKTGTLFSKESNMTVCVNRRLAIPHGVLHKDCVIPWRDQRVLSQVKYTHQTLCCFFSVARGTRR